MAIFTRIIKAFMSTRLREIEHFRRNPIEVQSEQYTKLSMSLHRTMYGVMHGAKEGLKYEEFASKIPVVVYDDIVHYIDKMRFGESNVLWDSDVNWFAKSSGTTAAKSKFIPVSNESLHECQYKGGKDALAFYLDYRPESSIFSGYALTLGGSHNFEAHCSKIYTGDLSAIMIHNTPTYAKLFRVPSMEVALMADFEKKIELICKETATKNITSFAGVPSWNMVLLSKMLEYTGKSNITEIWPNLELFIHGGISFNPYRDQYKKLIPSDNMNYMETYNASEGFFAIADNFSHEDMLLMLDYGVFYEFLETSSLAHPENVVPLEGVKLGVNYAMIITTNGGLWRYIIGDTVQFTSTDPYRIKITGRTKHFINVFGEEVMVDNADKAITAACSATGALIKDYTAAPVFMQVGVKGCHEWVVEFECEPNDFGQFCDVLDKTLMQVNSDYEAKRANDATLSKPVVTKVAEGTFYKWLHSKGKLGGQNKIPRLFNTREYVEQLIG